MPVSRSRTALALAVAGLALAASAQASAPRAAAVVPAVAVPHPPGYTIIQSPPQLSPAFALAAGSVSCPRHTVPFSGGVLEQSNNLQVDVASTFPTPRGWAVWLDNQSAVGTTYTVYAVCARRPARYHVVSTPPLTVPPGIQTGADARCPAGSRPLGGGIAGLPSAAHVDVNDLFPAGRLWHANLNDAAGGPASFAVVALCGRVPGYRVALKPLATVPEGQELFASADCPAGTVPIGGGEESVSADIRVNLNSTLPTPHGWGAILNNASAFPTAFEASAICAS